MISPDLDSLRLRARRAYERMRWHHAARAAWPVAILLPLALALHGPVASALTVVSAVALGAVLAVSRWRGGVWQRGALPGVLAGVPLFVAPSLLMPTDSDCGMACARVATPWLTCFAVCALAALAGGLALAFLARRDRAPLAYASSAAAAAILTASMTSALAGAAGLVGAVAGLAAGSVPVVVGAVRRA
jgi:hypothetical protein